MAWPQGPTAVEEVPFAVAPMAPPAPSVPTAPPVEEPSAPPAPAAPPAPPPAPATPTEADPDDDVDDEPADDEADQRVHHHARIDADGALVGSDTIRTLCGLRLPRPRPDAARMPCCPRCAAVIGGRCR
jgi:hypothetical protein